MILFACARDAVLPEIQRYGLQYSEPGHELHLTLEAARQDCGGSVLVVQLGPKELDSCAFTKEAVYAPAVAPASFRNLNPSLPPVPVSAGGGLVVRRHDDDYQVVCIHRRGTWDLPKGKLDEGETMEECALREVREELGIDDVELLGHAGTTVHGYAGSRSYHVKTTQWYWMRSFATTFEPQADEQIERADWVQWDEAAKRMGFDTLTELLRAADPANAGV